MIIFLALVCFFFLVGVFFRSPGEWVCENGSWEPVGEPRDLPPDDGCRPVPTPFLPTPTKNLSPGIPLPSFLPAGKEATRGMTVPYGFQEATEASFTKR